MAKQPSEDELHGVLPERNSRCYYPRRPKLVYFFLSLCAACGLLTFLLWWFLSGDDTMAFGKVTLDHSSQSIDAGVRSAIVAYWTAWLNLDEDGLVDMLRAANDMLRENHDQQVLMIVSQQTGRRSTTVAEALDIWREEWSAYERDPDDTTRLALGIRVHGIKQIQPITSSSSSSSSSEETGAVVVSYWLEVAGGARWSFDDTAFVTQVFDIHQKIVYHTDSWNLDHDPTIDSKRQVGTNFQAFDYVYPVTDMDRAAAFYDPIMGPPEVVEDLPSGQRRRIYDGLEHRFILDTSDLDGYVSMEQDLPSAYPIIQVGNINQTFERVRDDSNGATAVTSIKTDEAGDMFFLATDPGGNIIVVKEIIFTMDDSNSPSPTLSAESTSMGQLVSPFFSHTLKMLDAWLKTDEVAIGDSFNDNSLYFDDGTSPGRLYGYQEGTEAILEAIKEYSWPDFDQSLDEGLSIDMEVTNVQEISVSDDSVTILSFQITLNGTGNHPFKKLIWATHIYDGQTEALLVSTQIRSRLRSGLANTPMAISLDYTASPIGGPLRSARRFYTDTLKMGEPYRDTSWFGFYSFSAAYGIYRTWACDDGIPRDEKNQWICQFVANKHVPNKWYLENGSNSKGNFYRNSHKSCNAILRTPNTCGTRLAILWRSLLPQLLPRHVLPAVRVVVPTDDPTKAGDNNSYIVKLEESIYEQEERFKLQEAAEDPYASLYCQATSHMGICGFRFDAFQDETSTLQLTYEHFILAGADVAVETQCTFDVRHGEWEARYSSLSFEDAVRSSSPESLLHPPATSSHPAVQFHKHVATTWFANHDHDGSSTNALLWRRRLGELPLQDALLTLSQWLGELDVVTQDLVELSQTHGLQVEWPRLILSIHDEDEDATTSTLTLRV